MSILEKQLLNEFTIKISHLGGRVFRPNVGRAWVGKTSGPVTQMFKTHLNPGDLVIREARPFHAGFPKGSSDLIGWIPVEITKEMVGSTLAVFSAFEVKTGKVRTTKEQQQFIDTVNRSGGIATITRKYSDILDAIDEFISNFVGGKSK